MLDRVSRCGIRDDGDALVVRNPFRTVRLRWDEVRGFELDQFGIVSKVGVRLRDGSGVGVFGLPRAGGGADPSTLRLLETYERKLPEPPRMI